MVTITDLYKLLFGRKGIGGGNVIDMAEHGRQGGLSTGQPFKFTDGLDYAIKITEDGTDTYIAYAIPGSTEADEVWRAMKLDASSGLVITYADGDNNFDNVATDLTVLSYS